MSRSRGTSPVRCLLVWVAATIATTALHAWLLPDLLATTTRAAGRFDALLVAGCELAAVVSTGWLWVLVSLVVLDALRGRPGDSHAGVPRVVRRLVLAACGLSLATGLALPAHADPGQGRPASVGSLLSGLPVPDRMTTTQWLAGLASGPGAAAAAPALDAARDRGSAEVVVRPGDTLWDLAAADLAAGATDTEIAHRWGQIYAANRAVIGDDPDLILPGQRLVLPGRSARHGPR